MNARFRRFVAMFLVLVTVVGFLPVSAFATESTDPTEVTEIDTATEPTTEPTSEPTTEPEPSVVSEEPTTSPTTAPTEAPAEPVTDPPAGTSVTEPTQVTDPVTVTEPSETTVPTEATEPSETTAPTEVAEPTETAAPTEVTDPSETTVPTEVTAPSESTVPTEVTDPSDTTVPTEVTEPSETTEPTEVTDPSEATEPTEETESTGPVSDPTADLETSADWLASVSNVTLTGDPVTDFLAIAQSQLGYTESQVNFIVDERGNEDGITRYGQWFGVPYGDWCAMFVSFCLHYAEIDMIPLNSNCHNWIQKASELGMYIEASEWDPAPGDIVFFDNSYNDSRSDHVGIVYENDGNGTYITTIEGNYDDRVAYVQRSLTDGHIMGYIPVSFMGGANAPSYLLDEGQTGSQIGSSTGGDASSSSGSLTYSAPGITMQVVLYPYGSTYNRTLSYENVINTVKTYTSNGSLTVFNGFAISNHTFIGDPQLGRVFRLDGIDVNSKTINLPVMSSYSISGSLTGTPSGRTINPIYTPVVSAETLGGSMTKSVSGNTTTVSMPAINKIESCLRELIWGETADPDGSGNIGAWDIDDVAKKADGTRAKTADEDKSLFAEMLRYLGAEKYIQNYLDAYNGELDIEDDADVMIPTIIWSYVVAEGYNGWSTSKGNDCTKYINYSDSASVANGRRYQREDNLYCNKIRVLTVGDIVYNALVNAGLDSSSANSKFATWWKTPTNQYSGAAGSSPTTVNYNNMIYGVSGTNSCTYSTSPGYCDSYACVYAFGANHASGSPHGFGKTGDYGSISQGSGQVNRIQSPTVDSTTQGYHFRGYWTPFGRGIPATAQIIKEDASGQGDVASYDFKLWNSTTGDSWTVKTNSNGVGYEATVDANNAYTISGDDTLDGMTAGVYDILEVLSNKGKDVVYPRKITITIKNQQGSVLSGYPKTYYAPGGSETVDPGPVVIAQNNGQAGTITIDEATGNARLNKITFTNADVAEGNQIILTITNTDYTKKGSLSVQKAIAPSSLATATNLEGWVMELYETAAAAQSGAASGVKTSESTNSNGVATFTGLTDGKTYYIREAPAERQPSGKTSGWQLSSTVLSGKVVANIVTSVGTITNTKYEITAQKVIDPSSMSNTTNLANWKIELYANAAAAANATKSAVIASQYTNSAGKVTFNGDYLVYGTTYYVREAPAERQDKRSDTSSWVLSSRILTVTVTGNNSTINAGSFTNSSYGSLSVTKDIEPDVLDTPKNREGWVFERYATYADAVAGTNPIDDGTSNTDGVVTFDGLTPGATYYLREAPASRQTKSTDGWTLSTEVKSGTVAAGTTVSVGSVVNVQEQFVSIKKTANCSAAVFAQIENNPLYSLKDAQYALYIDGVYKETLTTDKDGNATSTQKYTYGQSGYLIETVAPPGYILEDAIRHPFTIDTTSTKIVNVSDVPVFDPGDIPMQKVDPETGKAMGNTTFEGAIFRWDFYATEGDWTGAPARTWYFSTNETGYHKYDASFLIDTTEYPSDELYIGVTGQYEVPLGSIKVTEVVPPAGYTVLNTPLYGTITQNGNTAVFGWTNETKDVIEDEADGTVKIEEPKDTDLPGSITITKKDAETQNGEPHYGTTFEGIEYTIYNNSTGPVKIGDAAVAQPGEACYVITLDADGNIHHCDNCDPATASKTTGNIFVPGSYTIKETKGNDYYNCNTGWEETFTVDVNGTVTNPNFSFECENVVVKGDFKLYKVEEGTNEGTTDESPVAEDAVTLKGAKFMVWNPDGSELGEYSTDENGVLEILDLPYGTYKYQETEAPAGFELDETIYEFTIDVEDEVETRVHENTPTVGSIKIKKESSYGMPMENVSFLLEFSVDDGETWNPVTYRAADSRITVGGCTTENLTDGILTTNEDGVCIFTGLRVNSQTGNVRYRLTEVATQSGFTLMTDPVFEGELPQTVYGVETVDLYYRVINAMIIELPPTGSFDMILVSLGPVIIALALALSMVMLPNVFISRVAENKTQTNERKQRNMKKKNIFTRLLSLMLILCMIGSLATVGLAATWDEAIIDTDATCSVKIHKIDWTNAIKDGVWNDSYVSTGLEDEQVEKLLTDGTRTGDLNDSKDHPIEGGSGKSNGYAIEGVQFSYLRVADIATFTESANDEHPDYNLTQVLYGFDKTSTAALLTAIGLGDGTGSYVNSANTDKLDQNKWWYESDTLNDALTAALAADATGVKDALETYIKAAIKGVDANIGGTMDLTDENGEATVDGLKVGLFIFVETLVPEMVTSSTNPFFLSLPMTNVNGGGGKTTTSVTDGGHEWLYNVNLYPKNETGIVSLEKGSREAKDDTGKNNASGVITDGFGHNTTASAGDTVEFQIITTLPTITSQATAISDYTFVDTMDKGLTYNAGTVVMEWFTDAECTNKVATWAEDDATAMFTASINAGKNQMTIAMTTAGLAAINGSAATAGNVNNGIAGYDPAAGEQFTKYAGYSNYTLRVTYTAEVDSDASFVYGDAGNKNEVILTWKRTSSNYYDTIVDDNHVYSYALDLTKLFSDKTQEEAYGNGTTTNMFNHVKFKMKNVTDNYYVIAKLNTTEGIWYVTGHTTDVDQATILKPAVIKDADGKDVYGHIVVKGLEDDTYELTEVETANGYTLLKDRITVAISVKETESYCDVYENEIKKGVYQNDGHYNYEGCPDIPLAGIPQAPLAHHTLTASATVDTNDVTMNNDTAPSTGASTDSVNAIVPLTVKNTRGFDLPQTGDFGTLLMSIGGPAIFAVCAVCLFVFFLPKRKEKKEQIQQ